MKLSEGKQGRRKAMYIQTRAQLMKRGKGKQIFILMLLNPFSALEKAEWVQQKDTIWNPAELTTEQLWGRQDDLQSWDGRLEGPLAWEG